MAGSDCWRLLALALLVSLAFQGSRGLYETTEGRYAEVAREMRASGDFLEPSLAQRPHWSKPPLAYWTIAGGMSLFGSNAWGARASNVLAFCATVLAVAAIGTRLWNPEIGFLAGLVYLSSPYPALAASTLNADTLLTSWVVLAVLAYVRAWKDGHSRGWVRAMWALFGLAFFTKGPPALLPLLALVVFHRVARRPFRMADGLGLALFIVVGLWWYGLEMARHHELLGYFLGHEILGRNLTGEFRRNAQWYGALVIYLPVFVLGQGAWLIDGIRTARRARLLAPTRVARAMRAGGTNGSFLLCGLLIPLAVFALSRSRLPLYVLPIYAPIALATARGIALAAPDAASARRHAVRLATVSVIALLALKAVLARWPSEMDSTRLFHEVERAAGAGVHIVLFQESELFGLQFHAGDRVERVSRSGEEPWADRRFADAVADLEPGRRWVLVARERHAPQIEEALDAAGLDFSYAHANGRALFVVPPR